MSRQLRAFIVGFTNAFRPVDYSNTHKYGQTAKRINNKIIINRRSTLGKINEVAAERSK